MVGSSGCGSTCQSGIFDRLSDLKRRIGTGALVAKVACSWTAFIAACLANPVEVGRSRKVRVFDPTEIDGALGYLLAVAKESTEWGSIASVV